MRNHYYKCRDAFARAYDETVHNAAMRLSSNNRSSKSDLWAMTFELDYGFDVWVEAAKVNGDIR